MKENPCYSVFVLLMKGFLCQLKGSLFITLVYVWGP